MKYNEGWLLTYNEPFVVYRENDGTMNEVLLDKITHVYGNENGAGSAYSYLCVEGGQKIRVLGKTNEIAEVLKGFYKKKSILSRLFS